jgi:hypothetical protein
MRVQAAVRIIFMANSNFHVKYNMTYINISVKFIADELLANGQYNVISNIGIVLGIVYFIF